MQLFPSMLMIWSDQRWAFYNYKKALAILKDLSGNLKIPQEFLSWIKKQMVGGFKYPALPTTPSNLDAAGTDEKGRDFRRSYFDWCIWFPHKPCYFSVSSCRVSGFPGMCTCRHSGSTCVIGTVTTDCPLIWNLNIFIKWDYSELRRCNSLLDKSRWKLDLCCTKCLIWWVNILSNFVFIKKQNITILTNTSNND